MTGRTQAAAERDSLALGVVRDAAVKLAAVEEPGDFGETADALIDLAAHLAAPWFGLPDSEDALVEFLQRQAPEQDVRTGLELAKHLVAEGEVEIPNCPWPAEPPTGRSENLRRGRPDRKRSCGAVNIAEGTHSEDPRRWKKVPYSKWLGALHKDDGVVRSRLAVAGVVGFHADRWTGAGAFASRETIGREVGLAVRQVTSHIKELEAAGWLRDTGRRRGRNGSIEYHLSLPPAS